MAKEPVAPIETQHPLEGMVTTIYLDPVNKKDKEGRAKIIKVTGSEAINKTQTLYSVDVHYIGDRRGYNVSRKIVMRSVTL
jgi:hypothetical protein